MQLSNTVVNMHESVAIKAYEKVMKEKHTKFHTKIVAHWSKNTSGCKLHLTFFVIVV